MRAAVLGAAISATLIGGAGPARGQTPRNCVVELVSAGRVAQRMLGPGRLHQFASGNVRARCIGQATTVRTDSFAHYPEFNRADFVGSVRFRDQTVALDAARANYHLRDERVEAFGQVQLVNRVTGSVLTGRRLTYWRAVPGVRAQAELFAVNRPRVEYRVTGDTTEPYVIIGDRVRLHGNSEASVGGDVTITRTTFAAKGDSATLDLQAGQGFLFGDAEVRSQDTTGYTLRGREIAFRLSGGELSWVQATGAATARSADWEIFGTTIEFQLRDEAIQAGSAWGDSTRALSQTYTITADSLAVDVPDQVLEEVRAFGTARAVANTDSVDAETDWMAGDSLTVSFAENDAGRRMLTRMEARGNAQAYYHIYEQSLSTEPPGVNYSRGLVITARFKDETLERVDVVGQADGVYLAPPRRRP